LFIGAKFIDFYFEVGKSYDRCRFADKVFLTPKNGVYTPHRQLEVKFIRNLTILTFWYLNSSIALFIYIGRAFEVRLQSSSNRLSDLMKLAVTAGFDWVYFETSTHIHISVVPDGKICPLIDGRPSTSKLHLL